MCQLTCVGVLLGCRHLGLEHIVFLLQNSTHALEPGCTELSEFTLPIIDASVEWSQPMPQGTYLLQALPALSCAWPHLELASHQPVNLQIG